jgi:hypothetical protein
MAFLLEENCFSCCVGVIFEKSSFCFSMKFDFFKIICFFILTAEQRVVVIVVVIASFSITFNS